MGRYVTLFLPLVIVAFTAILTSSSNHLLIHLLPHKYLLLVLYIIHVMVYVCTEYPKLCPFALELYITAKCYTIPDLYKKKSNCQYNYLLLHATVLFL